MFEMSATAAVSSTAVVDISAAGRFFAMYILLPSDVTMSSEISCDLAAFFRSHLLVNSTPPIGHLIRREHEEEEDGEGGGEEKLREEMCSCSELFTLLFQE